MDAAERLRIVGDRLERADRSLARNWATQMALVILSLLALFGNGTELSEASREHLGIGPSQPVLSGILAALLAYNFIRWGFLVGQFLLTRRECDVLAGESPPPGDPASPHRPPLFETTNFFEPVSQLAAFRVRGKLVLYTVVVITVFVIAVSHASAIVHVHRATGGRTVLGGVLASALALVLGGCYAQMWRSDVGGQFAIARRVMLVAPALALILLAAYVLASQA